MHTTTKAFLAIALFSISIKPFLQGITKLSLAPPDDDIGQIPRVPNPSALVTSSSTTIRIEDKNVLIIGGTRGVGFGTALSLAQTGARVTIVGRNEESAKRAISRIGTDNVKHTPIFVQGDIGTAASAKKLILTLADLGERFDYLVVTAAIFPHFDKPLLNEDGIDKSFGVAVVGRFIVYRNMHKFMNIDEPTTTPRVLNVLASGIKPMFPFHRFTVHNGATSLIPGIMNFATGNQIMMEALLQKDPYISKYTIISTHPGIIKTELHNGQGLLFDLVENFMVGIVGITEEEAGLRQATVLLSDRLKRNGGVSYVDEFGYGRVLHEKMREYVDEHMDWLWDLLTELE